MMADAAADGSCGLAERRAAVARVGACHGRRPTRDGGRGVDGWPTAVARRRTEHDRKTSPGPLLRTGHMGASERHISNSIVQMHHGPFSNGHVASFGLRSDLHLGTALFRPLSHFAFVTSCNLAKMSAI